MLAAPDAPPMTTLEAVEHFADVYLLPIGLKILFAVLIFIVGRSIARVLLHALDRLMERGKLDISLRKFLGDLAYAVLFVVVVIATLDTIGVKTTAVVAMLGAVGLAIGLALQGSLSNFAAGVMLIVLRPYKVGDVVVIAKYTGQVDSIKVFNTVVITGDHREITIPNGQIIAQPIENLTVLGRRRVDLVVTVEATADLRHVRQLLEAVVLADANVHASPPPTIDVAEVADTGVKLYLRPWTSAESYPKVVAATMERIKDTMTSSGLKYSVVLQAPPV